MGSQTQGEEWTNIFEASQDFLLSEFCCDFFILNQSRECMLQSFPCDAIETRDG